MSVKDQLNKLSEVWGELEDFDPADKQYKDEVMDLQLRLADALQKVSRLKHMKNEKEETPEPTAPFQCPGCGAENWYVGTTVPAQRFLGWDDDRFVYHFIEIVADTEDPNAIEDWDVWCNSCGHKLADREAATMRELLDEE